ncbi:MAG: indole-3-glycerol-phosphate synthase [Legionellaceae bacterium]|nr:indole-3-glycerol-phosphate synthase [Legionellaceae bacterium]
MHHFLDTIKACVYARKRAPKPLQVFKPVDFKQMFAKPHACIAEIKFASPSLGRIYQGPLSHIAIAEQYLNNGARALSILAEPQYFEGDIQYIADIRARFPTVPILLKDFVLSAPQIHEAHAYGASAVLLMMSLLSVDALKTLYQLCTQLGLTPVIEVASLEELFSIAPLKPEVVLVNNRNLKTQVVDTQLSHALMSHRLPRTHMIAASGIKTPTDLKAMFDAGYDACLVGTALMQTDNPGCALKALLKEEMHAN